VETNPRKRYRQYQIIRRGGPVRRACPEVQERSPQSQCSAEGLRRTRRRVRWGGAGGEVGRLIHRSRQARGDAAVEEGATQSATGGRGRRWCGRGDGSDRRDRAAGSRRMLGYSVAFKTSIVCQGSWSHINRLLSCNTTHAHSPADDTFGDLDVQDVPEPVTIARIVVGALGMFHSRTADFLAATLTAEAEVILTC
jgi:hypothetical protein